MGNCFWIYFVNFFFITKSFHTSSLSIQVDDQLFTHQSATSVVFTAVQNLQVSHSIAQGNNSLYCNRTPQNMAEKHFFIERIVSLWVYVLDQNSIENKLNQNRELICPFFIISMLFIICENCLFSHTTTEMFPRHLLGLVYVQLFIRFVCGLKFILLWLVS